MGRSVVGLAPGGGPLNMIVDCVTSWDERECRISEFPILWSWSRLLEPQGSVKAAA